MKGILLAGGSGTRLRPLTAVVSKQLLPVYNKPMIFYPLSTLMLAGIREFLLISTPGDISQYQRLFGDGSHLGVEISYAVQERPEGLPQAFLVGEDFLGGEGGALILGDNLLAGAGLGRQLASIADRPGGTILGVELQDPRPYGVLEFDADDRVISIEEKPESPKSNWAIPGIYFYDHNVVGYAKELTPSARGELEIVDLHRKYLDAGTLSVKKLSRGSAWLDMGSVDALTEAALFVRTLERRQGLVLGSPEEVAWQRGWIDDDELVAAADRHGVSGYAQYLRDLLSRGAAARSEWHFA